MEAILDFSREFDVTLIDRVVQTFYSSTGQEQAAAEKVLSQFQAHPDSWKQVDGILERASLLQTKFIALTILENLIKTMWKALPDVQRQGIKNFIVGIIIKTSSDEATFEKQKLYLNKLNMVLVQIVKQEWPHNWPHFISEIVESSKTNLSLCENNMKILKLLSEEIFDYSAEQMTQQKTTNLKNSMCGEFSEIFQLCQQVLDKAAKPSLISATLETLLRFLNWIPLGYIFETNIVDILCTRFLEVPEFKNTTLKCLTEIGGLQVGPEYNEKFALLFNVVMTSVNEMVPNHADLANLYETDDDAEQFIQNLGMFLTSFLGAHLKIIEASGNRELLINAHLYLIRVSLVKDREIFKVCLEYWNKLVSELYEEVQHIPSNENPLLNLGGHHVQNQLQNHPALRKHIYTEILSNLRVVMIERMVKPEEVLVVENDEGEIVRETLKESDTIVLYKSMREVLVYLTHLDVDDTETIMTDKLGKQMDGSEWSWDNLNKLAWAIGSISGAMNEETEKRFLVNFIKYLLSLCEMKRGKDNKAVVASNIMYIVGQYPRFLKAHWKFLKTVVKKLFEFMHELHEGVQDMACDTFMKICQKCKRQFVMQQPGELQPFIDEEILKQIDIITADLQPHHVHSFYESVGYMISAQSNTQLQERMIKGLMELPNQAWANVMAEAGRNPNCLNNPDTIKILGNIIKTNVAACNSIGGHFVVQIGVIYWDLLELYKAVSALISDSVAQQGLIATQTPRVRGMRTIKKEILKLVDTFIQKADDLPTVNANMIPPLLDAVLLDYARNVEQAREAEVLNLMAGVITRFGDLIADKIPPILDAVFECTLNMINKDFENFPEHRAGFFKMIFAINSSCFPALLQLPGPVFKLFLDSVVWGFKHTMRDISDLGLTICLELINNFAKCDPSISNSFFQSYYLNILQDIFFVLTNTFHKSGFKLQSVILAQMFQMVDSGQISAPLYNPATVPNPNMSNQEFLREHVMLLLQNAFPHLQPNQVRAFVLGLFEHNKDLMAFKMHLRDFLITLKEFAGDDNSDLYLEEKEIEARAKIDNDRAAALKIPGMVKVYDRPDDGMMD
ncbi:Karyopherin transporter [Physocladia obscura]|uniref:Karyopherin transporter n=1 Tax=Physocladia obscura TaxID=109957 RepID=A0AAD5T6V6_9FUNG|nr:Karyopherin transporter [Physocladia obscura]